MLCVAWLVAVCRKLRKASQHSISCSWTTNCSDPRLHGNPTYHESGDNFRFRFRSLDMQRVALNVYKSLYIDMRRKQREAALPRVAAPLLLLFPLSSLICLMRKIIKKAFLYETPSPIRKSSFVNEREAFIYSSSCSSCKL